MSLKVKSNGINFNVPTIEDLPTERLEEDLVCVVTDENRGGVFVYREANALVNNGGTIFNGWTRQYDGAVNVKWFGARGDNTTNDTAAIQNAIDTSNDVYIPNGVYTISAPLTFSDSIHLYGDNRYTTVIQSAGDHAILEYVGLGFSRANIHDIRLWFPTYDETMINRYGLKLSQGSKSSPAGNWIEQSELRNIEIHGAYYSIYNASGAWDIRLEGIYISDCYYGVYWAFGTTLTFTNVLVNGAVRSFYLYNILNVGMYSCSSDANKIVSGNKICSFISVDSLNIIGWSSESSTLVGNGATYFEINNCNGVDIAGAYFIGLTWDGVGGAAYQTFIKINNNSRNVKISNYQIPRHTDTHKYKNSPAQIAFITADVTTLGLTIVENCVFNNLTTDDASTTSVYFIQQSYIQSIGNIYSGYNFSTNRGYITSSTSPSIGYVKVGTIVYNSAPVASGFIGWVCTADGSPGTWKTFGAITA